MFQQLKRVGYKASPKSAGRGARLSSSQGMLLVTLSLWIRREGLTHLRWALHSQCRVSQHFLLPHSLYPLAQSWVQVMHRSYLFFLRLSDAATVLLEHRFDTCLVQNNMVRIQVNVGAFVQVFLMPLQGSKSYAGCHDWLRFWIKCPPDRVSVVIPPKLLQGIFMRGVVGVFCIVGGSWPILNWLVWTFWVSV